MVAGVSWIWWLGFHAVVAALLAADAWLTETPGGSPSQPSPSRLERLVGRGGKRTHPQAVAWLWTSFLVLAVSAFAAWIAIAKGHQPALEFVAGYAIESSLSIDNLFVFMVIFQGFRVEPRGQHLALLWGVAGAVLLRALFIAAGISLLDRFAWITWIFGVILLYAAWRLLRGGSAKTTLPEASASTDKAPAAIRFWMRRLRPTAGSPPGLRQLLPVILAIEATNLLFALDSIPAVLAVSHNPFVVYTSNIAAILGLRSLYFAVAALLKRFRYLHYGLSALLAFVAFKMLAAQWIEVPITLSLALMGAILAICALASWAAEMQGIGNREH